MAFQTVCFPEEPSAAAVNCEPLASMRQNLGFELLSARDVDVPPGLTFSQYQSMLEKPAATTVAITAVATTGTEAKSGTVLGLVLLTVSARRAALLSLFVRPDYRGRGIASALLGSGLRQAHEKGAVDAETIYTTRMPRAAAFEALLQREGWSSPQRRMIFGRTSPRSVLRQNWAQQLIKRPPHGAEAFPWREHSAADRLYVQSAIDQGIYPAEVNPFWNEDLIADISLGLRDSGGNTVGWLVCHTVPQSPGTIRYSRSFCHQAPAVRGNGPWLIAQALDRHVSGPLIHTHPTALFDVDCINEPMMALYRKRLEPYLDEIYESRMSRIAFSTDRDRPTP